MASWFHGWEVSLSDLLHRQWNLPWMKNHFKISSYVRDGNISNNFQESVFVTIGFGGIYILNIVNKLFTLICVDNVFWPGRILCLWNILMWQSSKQKCSSCPCNSIFQNMHKRKAELHRGVCCSDAAGG